MRKALLFICLGALSACQLSPPHKRPSLPTPELYPQYFDEQDTSASIDSQMHWQVFFKDERLKAMLALALENNRDLVVAALRVDEAMAAYGIQRSNRIPTIEGNADAQRSRSSANSFSDFSGISERYELNVSIPAFEFDFWGRVRNANKAALNSYFATREAALAFRLSLMREVAFAYLNTLEAAERITLAEGTVRARSEQVRIANRRLSAGVTSELEFRQAETLLTQAQAELASLRLSQAQNSNLLSELLGVPIDDQLPSAQSLGMQINTEILSSGLPSQLLESRPDILAAERQLIAARANIGVARAAFFPSISLTGSSGYSSIELDSLVGSGNRVWSYGPSIDIPIFSYGRGRANLNAIKAREKIAIAEYENAIQTAFREVADTLAGRRFLAEQIDAQERGIIAQRRLADLARKRYEEGVVRYIEVLDAERSLFSAEQALLQVRRIQTANSIALYIALGGGLDESQ